MSRELKKLREDYIDGEKFHDNDINDITTDVNLLIDKTEEIDNDKQDKLTAGDFISIDDDNVISVVNLLDDLNVSTGTTYSSAKIFEMITQFGFYIEVVDELPASGETKTIYFVRVVDTGNTENSGYTDYCDEYMWVDNEWELIGTTRIDLSDYYTKSETDALLEKKVDKPLYEHFHVKALANSGNTTTISISDDWGITEAQYSLDQETWSAMTTATTVSLNEGESVYIRQITKKANGYRPAKITTTGPISLHGNINDLVDYTEPYQTSLSGRSYIFSSYFSDNNYITDASELILPYTDLSDGCYNSMFYSCTSLTTAPELPATTLVQSCYGNMFNSCTSLTTAPALPATTLADNCYSSMFGGCTSLTTAPELPATKLANGCYYYMFNGCSNLNYIKCLATDISVTDCTSGWVNGVSPNGTFIKDVHTTWPTGDSGIPSDWRIVNHYDDVALENKLSTKVESSTIKTIWSGTQQEYDALQTYSKDTLYVIK